MSTCRYRNCSFGGECNGLSTLYCSPPCGGDQCICKCGGELECDGCGYCALFPSTQEADPWPPSES